jgi:hypothetical protein
VPKSTESPMRKLLYTMQVRGQTTRPTDQSQPLRTTGSAASCTLSTMISASGIRTDLNASDGQFAFFDSELRLTGPEEFQETGEIMFGDSALHTLRFSTAGQGHFTSGFEPGTISGTASWRVDSGEGQFAAARGFITSNFTITASGERCDFQCGVIFLPE